MPVLTYLSPQYADLLCRYGGAFGTALLVFLMLVVWVHAGRLATHQGYLKRFLPTAAGGNAEPWTPQAAEKVTANRQSVEVASKLVLPVAASGGALWLFVLFASVFWGPLWP